jgi:thioredoxin 1
MAGNITVKLDQSNYKEVTETAGKLVLVDFWAQWCAPCRAVAPVLETLAEEYPEQLVVGKLNVDENRDIAIQHGIQSIPTILVYKGGQKIDTLIGAMGLQDYKAAIGKHLDIKPGA